MNEKTTITRVRLDFRQARDLMRQAEYAMKNRSRDFDDLASIESELIACVATFSQWIEEQREEVSA